MFTATLEPLLRECEDAIELAKAGDITASRARFDRIRYYRSVMAHAETHDALSESELADSVISKNPELLKSYVKIASAVNRRLTLLEEWVSGVRNSFSIEELRSSREGYDLFIDDVLPKVWDFNTDIVVITDIDGPNVREALRDRGQEKFIWITSQDTTAARSWIEVDTIYVRAGMQIEQAHLAPVISRYSLPRVSLIVMEIGSSDEAHFNAVVQSIGANVIAGTTTKWLPELTTEQWIARIPKLTNLPSVLSLASIFKGADILLVSPGPSLAEDLELLSVKQDAFLILATMKALSALFEAGVRPDLAIWQDPLEHGDAIPESPEIENVALILNEGCHPSFFEAKFAELFFYPEPGFLGTDLSQALHGETVPAFAGTSVSTLGAVMALTLGAKSVTLLGQDLSVGSGQYVGESDMSSATEGVHLFCDGIHGDPLPTLPNYLSFIDEFRYIAQTYKDTVLLVNSTSRGAYLDGWSHLPLAAHPLLKKGSKLRDKSINKNWALIATPRSEGNVSEALLVTETHLDQASRIAEQIQKHCLAVIENGASDVTTIDYLERQLRGILEDQCPLLRYYTSRQSMALTNAIPSVRNLEENLRLSADYYDSIRAASRRLSALCESARLQIG